MRRSGRSTGRRGCPRTGSRCARGPLSSNPAHEPPAIPVHTPEIEATAAARLELAAVDPADEGRGDYAGPLLSDIAFGDFSKSALVRMADEVCLQQHLLTLGFLIAVRERADADQAIEIARKQFTGIAGLTSERLRNALGLGNDAAVLAQVLRLHPAWNPLPYADVEISVEQETVVLRLRRNCPGVADGAWPALVDAEHLEAINAMARGVNPHFDTRVRAVEDDETVFEISMAATVFREIPEVAITRFSTGADFSFTERRSLPLTVVQTISGRSLRKGRNMPNNFADLFEHSVDIMPDRVAVIQGERRVNFRDLESRANQLAHHLDSVGIGVGDHVGFQMHNSVETLETLIACFKLRAVPININYRYGTEELKYIYDNADLVALVHHRCYSQTVEQAREAVPSIRYSLVAEDRSGRRGCAQHLDAVRIGLREYFCGTGFRCADRRRPVHDVHRRHHRDAQGRHVAPRGHVASAGRWHRLLQQ